jgi:steroid delta-isomerase-like uncharacterized protein
MSPEELVHRFIDAYNQRDLATLETLYAQDAVTHDPSLPEPIKGREAIAAVIPGQWTAFPDIRWELRHPVVASDNQAAYEIAVQMTHDGPMPMPDGTVLEATGKELSVEIGNFLTLDDDGVIVEERAYLDATAVAMQLGLVG